ncbi:MAG: alpha/beta hydrolase [Deltaproteobacteria bacterium]|nr:alpha/beta hydrolase [Deltaproteobacteria bacterium]
MREPIFGGRAFVLEAGPADGPLVVLVHGLGDAGARDWDSLIPHLIDRYRVLAFDLPGFGRSTKANEPYSPDRYVKFIRHLVEARTSEPFRLVGHSMGGAISLLYAGTHPGDVERLVLADAAAILYRQAYAEHMVHLGLHKVPLDLLPGVPGGGAVKSFINQWVRPFARFEPDPTVVFEFAWAREKVLGGDPTKIAAMMLIFKNLGPAMGKVVAPTRLIWGEDDNIAPVRTGMLLESRLPHAERHVLSGCGHVPMNDQPAQFAELVREWLDSDVVPGGEAELVRSGQSTRTIRRSGEKGGVIEGDFARLELENCNGTVLRRVRARELVVKYSEIQIEQSRFESPGTVLDVTGSRVKMTGGEIIGDVAILAESSDLDLAGVRIEGRSAAVRSPRQADILCSVCPVTSPKRDDYLHGIYRAERGVDL